MRAERPWEELPALIAPAMRPGLRALADEMIETIRATVPAYSRPLEGAVAEGVRAGVEGALSQFLDVVEQGHMGPLPERELYAELGRGEARDGRTLEALLAAYRVGARVAWRRAAARARELELDGEMLALLAESIFAYIDELSAASAEGYAREQSAAAGEADRRRAALARLLIQHPPPDPAQIELAARDAGTELPERFAAVVWAPREDDRTASWLPLGSLAVADGECSYALVPDPDAPMRRLEISRAFGRRTAALGPSVPWRDAARSAQRATEVHKLISAGAIKPDGLVLAEDHLVDAAARARPVAARRAGRAPARSADRGERLRARAPAGDAGGVARVPRQRPRRRPRDPRAPADRALPAQPAARPVRRPARRPGRALRADGCHPRTNSARPVVAGVSEPPPLPA